eukprot:TRINITY_DN473_c0_g1_i1.p2 TRINITY_DN473_c0_g1~~TRINITY_DN473_c0_g1_i1.p2  ORF type:complete len:125 (-),score=50.25 TRINITY_DN473_c0_g1_i1:35-409(-)
MCIRDRVSTQSTGLVFRSTKMSFFGTRYALRYGQLMRQRAANVQGCACAAQRWNAAAAQMECLPGSIGRAKTDFSQFVGRFKDGSATGSDAWRLVQVASAWGAAFLVGTALGRGSFQGYKYIKE